MESSFFFILSILLVSLFTPIKADDTARTKRSDDVSLTSLQALVDQQVLLTQSLQAELQAEKNRAAAAEASLLNKLTEADREITALQSDNSALHSKIATISTPVAFTVRFKADDAYNGLKFGPHTILRFDDLVFTSTPNSWDPHTGIFTAPLAGTYSFFLSLMMHGTGGIDIMKNGVILDVVYSAHENQGSSQVMTHLAKGDRVWVETGGSAFIRGAWFTVFTGYLVRAD